MPHPHRPVVLLLLLSSTLALLGCRTSGERLARMHASYLEETRGAGLAGTLDESYVERQASRRERVRAMVEAGEIHTSEDRIHAAAILLSGSELEDLTLAERLALEAGEAGEPAGFRLAAEAIDRQCVRRGVPQKYGTQAEYAPVLKRWRLYPIDGTVSDAQREAMGLPSLTELRQRAESYNDLPR